ncbi:hypothetical protein ABZT03_05240 [Streptomyces sp. NPDC005574]|uniref:hypothetical protein n=1 Tax=Streptomyces sp. NPDC005574 TaxID=3156891 RepID=UPI0033B6C061
MGCDVHIPRHPWWDEEGEPITTQEWEAVVAADAALEMVQVARAAPRGQDVVVEYRDKWLAQMATHPQPDTHGAWLDWRNGRVVVKNPDEILIRKMLEIAATPGARGQGDDGEYYDA